jgi:hypothetical protein
LSELDRLDHDTTDHADVASVAPALEPPHLSLTGVGRAGNWLSPGNVAALQRLAGNRATAAVVGRGRAVLARLGTPLDQPLPPGAVVPAHGEDAGKQRRYTRKQFQAMWEAEQGHKLTFAQEKTIKAGCIGITANNLGGGNPPLDEVYTTFAAAHAAMEAHNSGLKRDDPERWVMFGMHFWSNQDPDRANRATPDHTAFLPDPSGKVDMTGYKYLSRPGFVNFDYGFWDEASNSHWHANHFEKGPADPMKVYQSTRATFSQVFEETPGETRFGYKDFDREVFGVAKAENYDPSRATRPNLTSPRFMRSDGKPDPMIERVFRGRATLRAGSPAGAVKMLQQALVDLKKYDLGDFGPAKDGVDGKYGSQTSSAVMQFKVDENLGSESEGSAGRGVIFRLDELFPP